VRILAKIWWIPAALYLVIAPVFLGERIDETICREISINIKDSSEYSFVKSSDLFSMIHYQGNEVLGIGINAIDLEAVEAKISELRELHHAEVYRTIDGTLHVEADQRDPLLRVITAYGNSYYIDEYGMIIPHISDYTPRLLVVNGNIEVPDECIAGKPVNLLEEENILKKVFEMSSFIANDDFWSRQVEQVYINKQEELEIVPRVGQHIIRFGQVEDYMKKFSKLKTFYQTALPEVGWNRYREIDIRFENQIVCKHL